MMSRSEAVREEALVLDKYRCQICGFNGEDLADRSRLHVHHVKPLGMGGSDSRDVVANCITLCDKCHGLVHSGHLKIERWTRGKELAVTDMENRRQEVWFDKRHEAERLQLVEARIQGLAMIEGDVARDLYELSQGYKLLEPDARSFAQYIAGRNVSANKATQAARAYGWMEENGLQWPVGLTSEKADIIRKAIEGGEPYPDEIDAQAWLDAAVDQSVSDLKQELIDDGLMKASVRWYIHIRTKTSAPSNPVIDGQIALVRARSVDEALGLSTPLMWDLRGGHTTMVIRADKFVAGLNWDRKTKVLTDRDGNEVPYKDLT